MVLRSYDCCDMCDSLPLQSGLGSWVNAGTGLVKSAGWMAGVWLFVCAVHATEACGMTDAPKAVEGLEAAPVRGECMGQCIHRT